jgi:rhamnosyltransferase
MPPKSVCAVIVTYHPSAKMVENTYKVLAQVQGLVVVDNGSSGEELNPLRSAGQTLGFQLIENGTNLGIAEALNRGIRCAKNKGYPWVVLFDQDSGITAGYIDNLLTAWEEHPERERVASIHPKYVDPKTRIEVVVPRARDGSPIFPMTSGVLMPTWIFDRIGWFASEYFMDSVDWEYSFRIRSAGLLVANSMQAVLLHSPGNPLATKILGHTFYSSDHSAIRRYYISRNSIAFYRKYFRLFPRWIVSSFCSHMRDTAICLMVEKKRIRKFRNFLLGTWDGLTGRMGKREGL